MLKDRKTKLAASFVVTVSAMSGVACRKQTVDNNDPATGGHESASIHREYDHCTMMQPMHCPKNVSCNPPPPTAIDCPATLRDAGEAVQGPTARPPGKEDWLRVQPQFGAWRDGCSFGGEKFCAAPPKPFECTEYAPDAVVKCKPIDASDGGSAGRVAVESFVYKDALGTCHKVPAFECEMAHCSMKDVPKDAPVPCP